MDSLVCGFIPYLDSWVLLMSQSFEILVTTLKAYFLLSNELCQ